MDFHPQFFICLNDPHSWSSVLNNTQLNIGPIYRRFVQMLCCCMTCVAVKTRKILTFLQWFAFDLSEWSRSPTTMAEKKFAKWIELDDDRCLFQSDDLRTDLNCGDTIIGEDYNKNSRRFFMNWSTLIATDMILFWFSFWSDFWSLF